MYNVHLVQPGRDSLSNFHSAGDGKESIQCQVHADSRKNHGEAAAGSEEEREKYDAKRSFQAGTHTRTHTYLNQHALAPPVFSWYSFLLSMQALRVLQKPPDLRTELDIENISGELAKQVIPKFPVTLRA